MSIMYVRFESVLGHQMIIIDQHVYL